jgi:hypothetical protein
MQFSTSLKYAGEVTFKEARISSLNGQTALITNQVISVEIFEDLFAPLITLSVVVKESTDFLNLFPFCGEEYLTLDITTPTLSIPIKGTFYIYKISDRIYTSEREVTYTLKCASVEFLTDANTKITKAFSGNITDNITYLLGKDGLNSTKPVYAERTANSTKFIANFWNPIKCVNYLASYALSLNNDSPSYLFFENRDGFNFISIDSLLKFPPIQEFVKDNYTRSSGNEYDSLKSYANVNEDYKRVLEINIPVLTDYIDSIQSGQLKSRMITHDLVTKKYAVKDYSVKKDTKPPTLLNQNPLYSKYVIANAASTLVVLPKHYTLHNDFTDTTNTKIIQKRLAFFKSLERFKVNIDVIGRTDYTVGKVVTLNVPKVTQITKDDTNVVDNMVSGKYLVTAISHIINRERHSCRMELVKNSVITNLSRQ